MDEDGEGVRWIPDHAVTHCFGCGLEFWTARRKHHCRCVCVCVCGCGGGGGGVFIGGEVCVGGVTHCFACGFEFWIARRKQVRHSLFPRCPNKVGFL